MPMMLMRIILPGLWKIPPVPQQVQNMSSEVVPIKMKQTGSEVQRGIILKKIPGLKPIHRYPKVYGGIQIASMLDSGWFVNLMSKLLSS